MEAITYTAARQNLAKTMEKVCRDRAPMIVTRKSSESVVIMSLGTGPGWPLDWLVRRLKGWLICAISLQAKF